MTFKNVPKDSAKNWTEDYDHENGMYQNRCLECHELFFGHKRRVMCKECFNKEIDWEKIALKKPPEEIKNNAWPGCWADGEMTGFARCMVKNVKPLQQEVSAYKEELASLKEVVKDLLPLAQEVFDSITIDDAETHSEYISLKALLDRAKTLLR